MKQNVYLFVSLLLIFCIAVKHVKSDDLEKKDKLEGQWDGELCLGPLPEATIKYTCDTLSLQFVQSGDRFVANGLFAGHLSLTLEGAGRGDVFYGTYRYNISSEQEYGSAHGFINNGSTLQLTIDYFQVKEKANVWMHGGVATLHKKEEK